MRTVILPFVVCLSSLKSQGLWTIALQYTVQYSIKYTVVTFFKQCALLLRSQMCTYCTSLSQQNTPYTYMLVQADIRTCRILAVLLLSKKSGPLTNKYDVGISTWQCMCFVAILCIYCFLHCLSAQSSTLILNDVSILVSFRMHTGGGRERE